MGFMTGKLGIPAGFAALAIAGEFLGAIGTGTLSRVTPRSASAMTMLVATVVIITPSNGFLPELDRRGGRGFGITSSQSRSLRS